jgi:hypothetical protein
MGTLIIARHQKSERPEAETASGRNTYFTPMTGALPAPVVEASGG